MRSCTILILFFLVGFCQAKAFEESTQTDTLLSLKAAGDAYARKNYAEAAEIYEQCIERAKATAAHKELAAAYYNLGNAYYRLKDFPRAVLNFRRCLRLNPAHEDAAFNLKLTESKLTDRFDTPFEMFFISWARDLVRSQSFRFWGILALISLVVTCAFLFLFFFGHKVGWRKVGFTLTIICFLLTGCFHLFAGLQKAHFDHEQYAVVMQALSTYSTPSTTAKKERTLHEGTILQIVDTFQEGWIRVRLPDQTECWVETAGTEHV